MGSGRLLERGAAFCSSPLRAARPDQAASAGQPPRVGASSLHPIPRRRRPTVRHVAAPCCTSLRYCPCRQAACCPARPRQRSYHAPGGAAPRPRPRWRSARDVPTVEQQGDAIHDQDIGPDGKGVEALGPLPRQLDSQRSPAFAAPFVARHRGGVRTDLARQAMNQAQTRLSDGRWPNDACRSRAAIGDAQHQSAIFGHLQRQCTLLLHPPGPGMAFVTRSLAISARVTARPVPSGTSSSPAGTAIQGVPSASRSSTGLDDGRRRPLPVDTQSAPIWPGWACTPPGGQPRPPILAKPCHPL